MLQKKQRKKGLGGSIASSERLQWSRGSALPKFAGSNPTEDVRIFKGKKSSAHLPSEGK
jgi:hypothetical protein